MLRAVAVKSSHKTERYLESIRSANLFRALDKGAKQGVAALRSATPVDTHETANSWGYTIERNATSASITWTNSHDAGSTSVVLLLQYGHGTGTGGYVAGRDFINPAIKPVFDKILDDVWRQVKHG